MALELQVLNPSGLHARPAAAFVRAACTFESDIRVANVTTGSDTVTAKSIIGVLGLGVQRGHRIRLVVDGTDEGPAVDTLRALVEAGLGETEPRRGEGGAGLGETEALRGDTNPS